jgi:hypothetical protein
MQLGTMISRTMEQTVRMATSLTRPVLLVVGMVQVPRIFQVRIFHQDGI